MKVDYRGSNINMRDGREGEVLRKVWEEDGDQEDRVVGWSVHGA